MAVLAQATRQGIHGKPKRISFRKRLAVRQAALVVFIACLLGLMTSMVQVYLDYGNQIQDRDKDIDHYISSVYQPAANALWELNDNLANAIIGGLLGYDLFVEASLTTGTDVPLAHKERSVFDAGSVAMIEWLFGGPQKHVVQINYTDNGQSYNVGTLTVIAHPYKMGSQFINRAAITFAAGFVKSLALAGVLLIAFYLTLTKPLESLSRQVSAINPTALNGPKISVDGTVSGDELDRIVQAVNNQIEVTHNHLLDLETVQTALEHANRDLEAAVAARTKELTDEIDAKVEIEGQLRVAAAKAEESAHVRTQFLANMSHELRTPLNAIIGYSEFAKMNLDQVDPEKLSEYLEHIRGAGTHLLDLVNSILDLSRLHAGRMPVDYDEVDVNSMIRDIVIGLDSARAKNSNTIKLDLDRDLPNIVSDPLKNKQVLFNLLGNAIKFTLEGTITVETRCHEPAEGMLTIRVRDTGIGIDPKAMPSIFDNFTQAEPHLSRRFGGSGLGLSIVRETCDLLDWHIAVESELGTGSCFTLVMPIRPAHAEATAGSV